LPGSVASVAISLSSLLLAGCISTLPYEPVPFAQRAPTRYSDAAAALNAGILLYESGRYEAATVELNRALDLGLRTSAEIVSARKYLAFVLCSTGNAARCRNEFREALRIDPNFELDKAESGHPMWGPAFIEVRKGFVARKR
jgi:tetratricopeptide (TPR) repeat protein